LNPEEDSSKRYMTKEKYIHSWILENFKSYEFKNNKTIEGGCSLKRPDWMIDLLTHSIIIECDEDQHNNYSCENKRMMQLFIDLGSRPLVLIRFNPDSYIDKYKKYKSCFSFDKNKMIENTVEWEKRNKKLKEKIIYYLNNIPTKEITEEKLFYNDAKIKLFKKENSSEEDESSYEEEIMDLTKNIKTLKF
jgi:hypothetical protein